MGKLVTLKERVESKAYMKDLLISHLSMNITKRLYNIRAGSLSYRYQLRSTDMTLQHSNICLNANAFIKRDNFLFDLCGVVMYKKEFTTSV